LRLRLLLQERHHPAHFLIGDKCAVDARYTRRSRRQVQQVAITEKLFRTHGIENGA